MTAERRRDDRRVVAAHERVLGMWSDDRVAEISDLIRQDPLYEPLSPTPTEAAFYATRERVEGEIEMEPVTETFAGTAVVVDWRPAE